MKSTKPTLNQVIVRWLLKDQQVVHIEHNQRINTVQQQQKNYQTMPDLGEGLPSLSHPVCGTGDQSLK